MASEIILVAGAGKSGISSAKLILSLGGRVLLFDEKRDIDTTLLKENFDRDADISYIFGTLKREDLDNVVLAVMSPGIPLDNAFVTLIREQGIPVWGEVELAFHVAKGALAAITGTNGKTTTTALCGAIFRTYFEDVYVVGNIGEPYTDIALKTTDDSVTAAEISSFQLETTVDFHPHVSAVLNITPDHLNRHRTMENYTAIKEKITQNQTEDDFVILNYDDQALREFGQSLQCVPRVIFFSSTQPLDDGLYLDGKDILFAHERCIDRLINVDDVKLLGRHNYENIMAAIGMSVAMGVPMENILGAVMEFEPVEHRIEFVLEHTGVKYYNDSKGTNPDAAIQAIRAMPGPTVLIAGGYDKQSEYDEWIESFDGKVRYLVLIGETRDKIAACARAHGFNDIMYAEDMEEAVSVAAAYAQMGDYVLLSPACASWDMFKNFEERGDIFKECVRNLL